MINKVIKSSPLSINIINRMSIKPDILHSYSSYNTFFDQALKDAIPHANTPEKAEQMKASVGRNWVKDIYNGIKNADIQDPSKLEDAIQQGYLDFAHNKESPKSFHTYATRETSSPFLPYWFTMVKHHITEHTNRNRVGSLNKSIGTEGDDSLQDTITERERDKRQEKVKGKGYWNEELSPEEQIKDNIFQYLRTGRVRNLSDIARNFKIPVSEVREHLKKLQEEGILNIPKEILDKPTSIPKSDKLGIPLTQKIVNYVKKRGSVKMFDLIDNYKSTASPQQVKLAVYTLINAGIIPKESIRIITKARDKNLPLKERVKDYLDRRNEPVHFIDVQKTFAKTATRDDLIKVLDELRAEKKITENQVNRPGIHRSSPLKDRIRKYIDKHEKTDMYMIRKIYRQSGNSDDEIRKAVLELIKNKEIPEGKVHIPSDSKDKYPPFVEDIDIPSIRRSK